MPKASGKERSMALYESILAIQNLDECYRFFQDLCSMTELRAIEQRFEVAALLNNGMVYTDILARTGASSATISRVNRALNYSEDGLKDVLDRVQAKKEKDENGNR